MAQWFRLYESLLDDPKVQRLKPDAFKAWINLLALASRHDGILPEVVDIGFALRVSEEKATELAKTLYVAGLLDRVEDGTEHTNPRYSPHNWASRQYKSDVSNERVKRYRERHRNAPCNVTETPSDTDTDTDTEQIKTPVAPKDPADDKFKLPRDWQPSIAGRDHAVSKGLNPTDVAEAFTEYFIEGRGCREKRTAAGWEKRFRIWCNTDARRGPGSIRSARRSSEISAFVRGASRVVGDEPV